MRYLDVCSGISAPTVAWKPLGWQALAYAEIEAAPRAVLAHHYPNVPLVGDFTQIKGDEYGPVDLLVGGTPCQDFSVAGLRAGLGGERGNLSLEYLRLADRARPRWLVWENVPGVLSIDGGRAFGAILGALGELGYGWAYRVLDAQHFGVPQRRRRVFVVGYLGDWRRAAAVLFERHSLQEHPAPRREKGQTAPTIPSRSTAGGGLGTDFDCDGGLIPQGCGGDVAPTINAAFGSKLGLDNQHIDSGAGLFVAHSRRAEGFDASEDGTGRGTPLVPVGITIHGTDKTATAASFTDLAGSLRTKPPGSIENSSTTAVMCFTAKDHGADASELAPTLRAGAHSGSHANAGVMPAVAFNITPSNSNKDYNARETERAQALTAGGNRPSARGGDLIAAYDMRGREGGAQMEGPHDTANLRAADGGSSRSYVATSAVRRLTPRECERLQGFPDDFTLVPYRNGMMADGPRYKMLGNSMAVPVVRWIGERIAMVDDLCAQLDRAA